jgi:D-alanyl-D-alanine carboxypeptidase
MQRLSALKRKEQRSRPRWARFLAVGAAAGLFALALPFAVKVAGIGIWPSVADIKGTAWVVMDCQTGKVLVEHQADLPVFPASTTKIMTAILALESGDLDRIVTVSPEAVNLPAGSSKVGYLAGEEVNLRDVLYGMMLPSGNDAANIVAESIAGSQEDFVERMNVKAAILGMTGSHFMNPSGLQDAEHVVTARDMARLAAYAMKNQKFRELVATRYYSLPPTNLHPYFGWAILANTNRLLQYGDTFLKSDYLASITGIKTGSTNNAGNNLIASAISVSGHELVSALMGVPFNLPDTNIYVYSRTLLEEAAKAGGSPSETTTSVPTTTLTSATSTETTSATSTATTSQATTQASLSPTAATATTAGSKATTGQQTTGPDDPTQEDLAALQKELIGWRSLSVVLLIVVLALLMFAWLYFNNLRRRRQRIRPRRIR